MPRRALRPYRPPDWLPPIEVSRGRRRSGSAPVDDGPPVPPDGRDAVERWWRPAAAARGFTGEVADRIWEVLAAFASFGFCKAHAAAFALPTYQSAWLKTHYPAHFMAGVLTHDPGMYPKRLIMDDARELGVEILGLDVNASGEGYRVERVADSSGPGEWPASAGPSAPDPDLALDRVRQRARQWGVRIALTVSE